jgi:hypothetical protein
MTTHNTAWRLGMGRAGAAWCSDAAVMTAREQAVQAHSYTRARLWFGAVVHTRIRTVTGVGWFRGAQAHICTVTRQRLVARQARVQRRNELGHGGRSGKCERGTAAVAVTCSSAAKVTRWVSLFCFLIVFSLTSGCKATHP